jgi:hypothetical protein
MSMIQGPGLAFLIDQAGITIQQMQQVIAGRDEQIARLTKERDDLLHQAETSPWASTSG